MGTQLPPRHALLPSLQSPTADNHYAPLIISIDIDIDHATEFQQKSPFNHCYWGIRVCGWKMVKISTGKISQPTKSATSPTLIFSLSKYKLFSWYWTYVLSSWPLDLPPHLLQSQLPSDGCTRCDHLDQDLSQKWTLSTQFVRNNLKCRTMFMTQHVVFAVGQETQVVGNSSAGFVSMFPSPSFWSHLLLFLNVAPATKHQPPISTPKPPHLHQKKINQSDMYFCGFPHIMSANFRGFQTPPRQQSSAADVIWGQPLIKTTSKWLNQS